MTNEPQFSILAEHCVDPLVSAFIPLPSAEKHGARGLLLLLIFPPPFSTPSRAFSRHWRHYQMLDCFFPELDPIVSFPFFTLLSSAMVSLLKFQVTILILRDGLVYEPFARSSRFLSLIFLSLVSASVAGNFPVGLLLSHAFEVQARSRFSSP